VSITRYYEPIHQVCVPYGVTCKNTTAASFSIASDCSCSRESGAEYEEVWNIITTKFALLVFPLEICVSLALLGVEKAWICNKGVDRLIYPMFYILAALTFTWGLVGYFLKFQGEGAVFAKEVYLLFTLEAIQLILHFCMAHAILKRNWSEAGYELFQKGFDCKELCIFLLASSIALVVGIVLDRYLLFGMKVVAGLCGLLLLIAFCDELPDCKQLAEPSNILVGGSTKSSNNDATAMQETQGKKLVI
jgi:hypothetical protein